MLYEFNIPCAASDLTGRIIWLNEAFKTLIGDKDIPYIQNIFPSVSKKTFMSKDRSEPILAEINEKKYLLEISGYSRTDQSEKNSEKKDENSLIFFSLKDETDLLNFKKLSEDVKACEGLIYLDNYDEVFDSVEEVRRSLLSAMVDRRVSGYLSKFGGVVKKLENDKYIFFIRNSDLESMVLDNFSLLDDVKNINIGSKMKNYVTLSIGIGKNGANLKENDYFARSSIEFAMGRGGDQAVLKDGEKVVFYGGKTEAKERHTRVKARVKADALSELMKSCDLCLVMGHKDPDVDSLGASMGFWRIANSFGKECRVVISNPSKSLLPLYNSFKESPDYGGKLFIRGDEAISMVNEDTMVLVVDVNRPSRVEEPGLLEKTRNIAIIDHHRVSSEIIKNAALTYIEPYASSSCEMLTEIIQYLDTKVKLSVREADAMYAGIIVDTQNFSDRTGVRTFEAAAYLKRAGADSVSVRKLMRDSANDYRARATTIERAEIYKGSFAISDCDVETADSPTVIGAQAANSLLEIDGIKAAIVLTPYGGKIYVSARSIDEVNVQLMMEKLGGGGHISVAGAQLSDMDLKEARTKIKAIIDEMIEKGDIK